MSSYFKIVQFVPDPAADERVNIGVLTYGDGKVRARWITDWKQAAKLARRPDADFLRDIASSISTLSQDEIQNQSESPIDVIYLTEQRASLLQPDELLLDIAERFLRSQPTVVQQARTHVQAAQDARRYVREALESKLGPDG